MAWKDNAKVVTYIERQVAKQVAALEAARNDEIEVAKESAGLRDISVSQAEDWIENKMDSATNVAEVREAIKEILLKMVPYLLK